MACLIQTWICLLLLQAGILHSLNDDNIRPSSDNVPSTTTSPDLHETGVDDSLHTDTFKSNTSQRNDLATTETNNSILNQRENMPMTSDVGDSLNDTGNESSSVLPTKHTISSTQTSGHDEDKSSNNTFPNDDNLHNGQTTLVVAETTSTQTSYEGVSGEITTSRSISKTGISNSTTSAMTTTEPINGEYMNGGRMMYDLYPDNDNDTFYNASDYSFYYEEADIERVLIDYSIWVTSVPGVICNSVTIVVVLRMKPFTTANLFMLTLGVTDLVNVVMRITSALTYILEAVSDATCKIVDYVIITTFNYSNIILVLWTIERFIAVWFPFKCTQYCTNRNTSIALIVAGIVFSLLALPYPISASARQTDFGFVECSFSEFLYLVWNPIETIYYIWIPLTVIVTLNVLIVYRLRNKNIISKSFTTERAKERYNDQQQITKVLFGVCLSFFLLHLPQACAIIYLSIQSGKLAVYMADPFGPLKSLIWCFIITEFQNSINFFLYCLAGRQFRSCVINMICCRKPPVDNVSKARLGSMRSSSTMNKY